MMHKLMFSKARLSYYKVRRGGRNALDFQMSSYLGYLINTHGMTENVEFFLISKDNGFDFVIDFWESGNIAVTPKIKRFYTIKAAFAQPKSTAEKLRAELPVEILEVSAEPVAEPLSETVEPVVEKIQPVTKKKPAPKKKPEAAAVAAEKIPPVAEVTEQQETITDEAAAIIDKLLSESKSSHELYIGTVKRFGQKKGVEIYREIKSRFTAQKTG
jgi:hypothetical protein